MRINTGIKVVKNTQKSQPKEQSGGLLDLLPAALGTVGSIGGETFGAALSAPTFGTASPVTVPAFGSAGGALGQGFGQGIENSIQGKPLTQDVPSQMVQGGVYGAVPGSAETKLAGKAAGMVPKMLAKPLVRAGVGAAQAGGAQAVRNVAGGQPVDQGVGGQALIGGILNNILPGSADLLGFLGKGVQKMGEKGGDMGRNVVNAKELAPTDAAQKLLGGQIIQTGKGGTKVDALHQGLFDKYGYTPPPEGNVQDTGGFLNTAGQDIEKQLQPILKAETASTDKEINPLIEKNLETFYGSSSMSSKNKAIPPEMKTYLNKVGSLGGNPSLSQLKDFQRGLKDYGKWPLPDNPTQTQRFANTLYRDTGNLIENKLKEAKLPEGWDATKYKELQQQHQAVAKMRDNFQPFQEGKQIPLESMSSEMGKQKMLRGLLSNERLSQIALRAAAPVATQFIPGLPSQDKLLLGLIESSLLMPGAFPETGPAIEKYVGGTGKAMQSPANNKSVMNVLKQLGVRLPGMLQQGGQ